MGSPISRRTLLGGILAGATVAVAGQLVPLRERQREIKEAWPTAKTYVHNASSEDIGKKDFFVEAWFLPNSENIDGPKRS